MKLNNPFVSWLTLNRNCNNRCSWCYAQNASLNQMGYSDAIQCIGELSRLGIKKIVLIGGEPTIYPFIIDIIKYIQSLGIKSFIVSNGRRFSDKSFAKQCIDAGVTGIDISLKGLSSSEYIANTQVNGFQESIDGYHNLSDLGFHPTLSYVICQYDLNLISKLKCLMSTYHLNDITIQFLKPTISIQAPNMSISMCEMGKMVSSVYRELENSSIHYRIEVSFPLCLIDEDVRNLLIQKRKLLTCCHVQKGNGLVFDTQFRLLPCNHFIDMPYENQPIGLWDTCHILEFWNSKTVKKIRQATRHYPSQKCISCPLWDICGGGCFTRWFYEDPEAIIPGC